MATNKDVYVYYKKDYIDRNFKKQPSPHYVKLTDAQKEDGVISRYFCHFKSRPNSIIEISKDDYNEFKGNQYYTVVKISWYIKGKKETTISNGNRYVGVIDSNKNSLEEALLTMPGLAYYITDYTQFWQGE